MLWWVLCIVLWSDDMNFYSNKKTDNITKLSCLRVLSCMTFYIYTKYIMYVFWLPVVQMFMFAALNSWLKQRKKWIDKTGKKWCASNTLMHCHINYFAIQRKVITYTPKSSCSPSPRLNMFSSQTLNNDDINDVWSLVLGMTAKTCFMVLVKLSIPFSFPNIMSSWPNT